MQKHCFPDDFDSLLSKIGRNWNWFRHTDRHLGSVYRNTHRQADRQTEIQENRQAVRLAERRKRINRQKDRQKSRQKDQHHQTDRHPMLIIHVLRNYAVQGHHMVSSSLALLCIMFFIIYNVFCCIFCFFCFNHVWLFHLCREAAPLGEEVGNGEKLCPYVHQMNFQKVFKILFCQTTP